MHTLPAHAYYAGDGCLRNRRWSLHGDVRYASLRCSIARPMQTPPPRARYACGGKVCIPRHGYTGASRVLLMMRLMLFMRRHSQIYSFGALDFTYVNF